ncbi:SANT/Myb domain [Arabidopsis thaliana x Arabidopsis arenosa]|uniref:SANT/Myb domain n=1 Tax=Arabidopsis thaliana x Arabidopsis arenosa TaxID=1240361 RepID=A0A8T2C2C8_9BRAS|nr:SANT/Myb domain [Arabidopsis thaliana x Arabidopsis arenosa]
MAAEDRSEELSSNVENGSCNSNEGTNPETSSHWIENVVKVRKPYTVTKQREKWSEEEHDRFLEAIKLYGRGWRQIQEHIGTKTAVQIRSHAQKFFSKMAQEPDNINEGSVKAIVIPPPRPKRKPAHPYPRKSPVPYSQSPPSNFSAMEKGTKSPTSVLSSFASEDQINICSSPNSCTSDIQSIGGTSIDKKNDYTTSKQSFKEDSDIGSTPMSSITLFGKIVLVVEESRDKPSSYRDDDDPKSMTDQENHYSGIKNSSLHIDTNLSLGVWETSCTGSNAFGSVTEVSEHLEKSAEPISSSWKQLSSFENQGSCNPATASGFRPYKRCLSEREVTSSFSLVASEEQKSQRRARIC